MSKIHEVLLRLQKVRQTGHNKWLACCSSPGHDDKHPSMSIKLLDDGRILLHCFSGNCDIESIVSGMGLTLADLMPEKPQMYDRRTAKIPQFNKFEMFDRVVFESMLLSLAIRELLNGKDLATEDLQRIEAAEELINELAREVRV